MPEPSDIIFDNDTRVSSIAGSSAAPSTAGAAQRRSVSVSPNAATASQRRWGAGGERGGSGGRATRSSSSSPRVGNRAGNASPSMRGGSSSRRHVVNFDVPPPACRLPYAFEQRKRDSFADVQRIASTFAVGVVDAALHRSSVALVSADSLSMSSSASTKGGANRGASSRSRRTSLNESVERGPPVLSNRLQYWDMERTLRRRELSCPPASLLARREVSPREEGPLDEMAEAGDGDGGAHAVGSAGVAPMEAAARKWARDEIAGCVASRARARAHARV